MRYSTQNRFETSPSTTTLCLLSMSHFSIQLIIQLPMPWAFSFSSNLWCGTLSKAFFKSKYIISTGDPSSTHFVTSSKNHKIFVKHDLAFRNPCWDGFIKLFLTRKSTKWSISPSNSLTSTLFKFLPYNSLFVSSI